MASSIRNPRNDRNKLFKRLTRVFSGPIVNRRSQTYRDEKRRKLDKYRFASASGQAFKKSAYSPFEHLQANAMANQNRSERYIDFDQMEYDPILASALDIYADEMTTSTSLEKMMSIECSNEEIKSVLHNLYNNILNINYNLFGWCRTMCKYGDFFLYLDTDEEKGVTHVIGLPTHEVERLEGEDKTNPNYIQFQWNSGGLTFENWQIAHFRILGNDKYTPYGTSVLEPARRIWRMLCVAKGELISTPFGPVPIEDIKEGDIVYCFDPKTGETSETKVVKQTYMGKQDVYELKTNHRNIKVTDKHGMLVYDKEGFSYKRAKDIEVGKDKIPLSVITDGQEKVMLVANAINRSVSLKEKFTYESAGIMEKITKGNFEYSNKNIHAFLNGKKRIPYEEWLKVSEYFDIPNSMTECWSFDSDKKSLIDINGVYNIDTKFARLFGFLLGDGWTGKNKVGFADGVDEEQNQFYRELLEDISQTQAHITLPERGIKSGQTNIFSKEFKEILEAAGFETGAFNKTVPSWIYSMSLEARRAFVRGYFDADGGYSDGRATSISYKLLEGIRELAMMSGIPCGAIKEDKKAGKKVIMERECNIRDSYRLYINMNEEKWSDEYILETVLSYTLAQEDEDTYDIQVEDELHNFIVNGMVSHNTLLEDAMMAYRVVRASDRRVFYIDVGHIAPQDVEQYMQKAITQMKRNMVLNDTTGRVDLRYNPLSVEEDYFIPVRGNVSSKIEPLPGGNYTGDIDDVKYLRDKLFSAIKIPQSYLSRGDGGEEDKTTLAQKDIRFARTIQRLQTHVISELERIGLIHLYILGYRNDDLLSFKCKLNNPSKISELQDLEHWRTKFDVAAAATEGFFSRRWIAKNVFNLSDEEFLRNQREMYYDRRFEASLEMEAEEGMSPGGGFGGDDMDLSPGEDEEIDDLDGVDLDGDGQSDIDLSTDNDDFTKDSEENTLLAAPAGKRDDKLTTTTRSKGKRYKPVRYSGGDRRKAGARARSNHAKWAKEKAVFTPRNVLPGANDLKTISNGIYEEWETIYREQILKEVEEAPREEKVMLEVNTDIEKLIVDLENIDVKKEAEDKAQ